MSDAHVRVIYEIRAVLKELHPTLKRLREIENKNPSPACLKARRHMDDHNVEVEKMIGMCEELSKLLWFEGREK